MIDGNLRSWDTRYEWERITVVLKGCLSAGLLFFLFCHCFVGFFYVFNRCGVGFCEQVKLCVNARIFQIGF